MINMPSDTLCGVIFIVIRMLQMARFAIKIVMLERQHLTRAWTPEQYCDVTNHNLEYWQNGIF